MGTKTDSFDQHERAELDKKSNKVKLKKELGESCRTCRYFYHRKLPRPNGVSMVDETHNDTMCSYKKKPVKHYNICEIHVRLVVQLIPISEHLK